MSTPPIDFKKYCAWAVALNAPILYMVYPLRLVKTLQQNSTYDRRVIQVIKDVVKSDGALGLYKGSSAFASGVLLARLFQFGAYDGIKSVVGKTGTVDGAALSLMATVVSGASMSVILTPFDVIAQRRSVYKTSMRDIVVSTIRDKGPQGLFRGYPITACIMIPYTMCFFGVFNFTNDLLGQTMPMPLWKSVVSGGVAGAISSAVSVPLDVIKTRIQLSTTNESTLAIISRMKKEEGWRVFGKGFVPRVMVSAPMAAISFVIFDVVKRLSTIQ